MTPTNNNYNYRQRQQQRLHRRQLLLASCTIIGLALLTSSLLLPAALNDSASNNNNNNNNNATTSSFEAAMSLERWIELQRPSIASSVSVSSHQRRRREDDIRNVAHSAAAYNNHSGIQAILPSSIISTTDLAHLSYDSSCLSNEGHRVLGAKYLEGRRSSAVASTSAAMMSMMSREDEMIHSKQDHPRHRWLDHNNAADAEMSSQELASVQFPDNNGNSQYLRGGGISVTSTASSGNDEKEEDNNSNLKVPAKKSQDWCWEHEEGETHHVWCEHRDKECLTYSPIGMKLSGSPDPPHQIQSWPLRGDEDEYTLFSWEDVETNNWQT